MASAIEACFRRHRARVYRWALGLCRRDAEALDITQDVFVKMIESRPVLENEAAEIGWLRRVVSRVAIDRWRAGAARLRLHAAGAERNENAGRLESRLEAGEQVSALRAALAHLSEQQRLVLICKTFDGMTFAAIADELGLATPTVKTHYLRGLAAVRERLGISSAMESVR